MIQIDKNDILEFGIVVAGLIGIGYAFGVNSKMKKVADKLDTTIDDMAKDVPIDIPDELVHQAVEMAAERAAMRAANDASPKIVKQMQNDIYNQVSSAVANERGKIRKEVTNKITEIVDGIDENDIRQEVVENAKHQIADKYDYKLNDLLDDFNSNLKNVSKIYKAIADTMSGNRDGIFKIA